MSATVIRTPFQPDPDVLQALRNQIQAIEQHAPAKIRTMDQNNAHQDETNAFVYSRFQFVTFYIETVTPVVI